MMVESMILKSGYRFSEKIMLKQLCSSKRICDMNDGAGGFEHSTGQAGDDILHLDVSDAALEAAASAIPGGAGGAMSFPNAPTVSILVVCCSFDGS